MAKHFYIEHARDIFFKALTEDTANRLTAMLREKHEGTPMGEANFTDFRLVTIDDDDRAIIYDEKVAWHKNELTRHRPLEEYATPTLLYYEDCYRWAEEFQRREELSIVAKNIVHPFPGGRWGDEPARPITTGGATSRLAASEPTGNPERLIPPLADRIEKWSLSLNTSVDEVRHNAWSLAVAIGEWGSVKHWLELRRSVEYANAFEKHISSLQTEADAFDAILLRKPSPDERDIEEAQQILSDKGVTLAKRFRELEMMLNDPANKNTTPQPHTQPEATTVYAGRPATKAKQRSPLDRMLTIEGFPSQEDTLTGSLYNLADSLWKFAGLLTSRCPLSHYHGTDEGGDDSMLYGEALAELTRDEADKVQRLIWGYPKLTPAHADGFRSRFYALTAYAERYYDTFVAAHKEQSRKAGELFSECCKTLSVTHDVVETAACRQGGVEGGYFTIRLPGQKPRTLAEFANDIRQVWWDCLHEERCLQAQFHKLVEDLVELIIDLNNMILMPFKDGAAASVELDPAATKLLSPVTTADDKKPSHSPDFTSVNWFGVRYSFDDGLQARCISQLMQAWEAGEHSLSEKTIGEKTESAQENFRLDKVFRAGTKSGSKTGRKASRKSKQAMHPAWRTMIHKVSPGVYILKKP